MKIIKSIPNQITLEKKYSIIKGGFVFNTGYHDLNLSPGDTVWKMGNHDIYEIRFKMPLTYVGFMYMSIYEAKENILLLFQDANDRLATRDQEEKQYKCFVYNSRKSIYCLTENKDEVINIYMNSIDFIKPSEEHKTKLFELEKPVQLSLF